jgi:hypothetical protein
VLHTACRNSGGVFIADLHAVAPAPIPGGSIAGWIQLAIVLALIVAGSVFLTARR